MRPMGCDGWMDKALVVQAVTPHDDRHVVMKNSDDNSVFIDSVWLVK